MTERTTLKDFEAVFPKLEAVLTEHAKGYAFPQKEFEW
jgi:farnesyl diphosphate synthase